MPLMYNFFMERSRLLEDQEALRKKIGAIQEQLKKIDYTDEKEIYEKIKGTIRGTRNSVRYSYMDAEYCFIPDKDEIPHHVMRVGVNSNSISVGYEKYYGKFLLDLDVFTEAEIRKNLDGMLETILKRFFE